MNRILTHPGTLLRNALRLAVCRPSYLAVATLALLVGTLAMGTQGFAQSDKRIDLPDIGDSSGGIMTPMDDKRLGEAFMRSVRRTETIIDDPELSDYIQSLGNRLTSSTGENARNFTFFLVDDPSINAFAGPGGYVGVNTGLILASENESELAGVMAHEIAHVTQKHLQRAFDEAKRMEAPMAAATVLAVLLGAAAGGDMAGAAILGAQAGAIQSRINFTRTNELEADRVGMGILADADFDPEGMPNFFEKLEQATRYYGRDFPEYLMTHPVTSSRIADTRSRAKQYGKREAAERLSYRLARGKLRARAAGSPQNAVKELRKNIRSDEVDTDVGDEYGLSVALLESNKAGEALQRLDELMEDNPEQPEYLTLRARTLLAVGKINQGMKLFQDAISIYPSNRALVLYYAEALLKLGHPKEAKKVLTRYMRDREADPVFYKMLAVAAGKSGNTAEGHRNMAEFYYRNGLTGQAIAQLEIALRNNELDYYSASQAEARLQQLRQEQAVMKQKAKG